MSFPLSSSTDRVTDPSPLAAGTNENPQEETPVSAPGTSGDHFIAQIHEGIKTNAWKVPLLFASPALAIFGSLRNCDEQSEEVDPEGFNEEDKVSEPEEQPESFSPVDLELFEKTLSTEALK